MPLATSDAKIRSLGLHPGKSMRYEADVEALTFDSDGLFGDREIMLVEASSSENPGTFVSQRKDSQLARIIPKITIGPDQKIKLRIDGISDSEIVIDRAPDVAANHLDVSVHRWSCVGVDQGDLVASWASDYLGRDVRLVARSNVHPRFVEAMNTLGKIGFSDGYPLLVISTGSVAELNRWLAIKGLEEIDEIRFRPTLYLDSDEAFIEDKIASITFYDEANGSELVIARAKACERCTVPGKDQITGETTHNVLKALGGLGRNGTHSNTERYGFNKGMFFGQNFVITSISGPFVLTPDTIGQASFSTQTNWVPSR